MSDPLDKARQDAQKYYDIAENEVDSWFSKNKYTVVILTAVAIVLVVGLYNTFF